VWDFEKGATLLSIGQDGTQEIRGTGKTEVGPPLKNQINA
jgi:hypothetical protein